MVDQGRENPTTDPAGRTGTVLAAIERSLAEHGPSFLATRRWFGDKSRSIVSVEPIDSVLVPAGLDLFVPTIARVRFADGGEARYFVPLVVTDMAIDAAASLGQIDMDDRTRQVAEAITVGSFREWLLDRLVAPGAIPMRHGTLTFTPTSVLDRYIAAAQTGPNRIASGEQSNTSVIYGDAAILKAFRKLQPGLNPDIEIGRYLTDETAFGLVPPLLGAIEYTSDDGEATSIALLQVYIPSSGDAWSTLLGDLSLLVSTPATGRASIVEMMTTRAALLGQRTAELHVALSMAPDGHPLAPEAISAADVTDWGSTLNREIEACRAGLARLQFTAMGAGGVTLPDPSLESAASGFADLIGSVKIRVHGDYHLGQVLQTLTGDVVILDFEGEPSRPVAERRAKSSPLRDVAGMLRSFTYARVAVARSSRRVGEEDAGAALLDWEDAARAAFLAAYRGAASRSPVPLYPADEAAFARALRAWEVQKAIYEVGYERDNRPDWLPHVLATLDRLMTGA